MIYLLDTNVCVAALRDNHSGAALRLAKETPGSVALCSVVRAELFYGAFKLTFRSFFSTHLDFFYAAALNSVPKSTLGSLNDKL